MTLLVTMIHVLNFMERCRLLMLGSSLEKSIRKICVPPILDQKYEKHIHSSILNGSSGKKLENQSISSIVAFSNPDYLRAMITCALFTNQNSR